MIIFGGYLMARVFIAMVFFLYFTKCFYTELIESTELIDF